MKRPSFFLVVFIKTPDKRWGIPLVMPLFVLQDAVSAGLQLLKAIMWAFPGVKRALRDAFPEGIPPDIIWSVGKILSELRVYGSWTLVDILAEDGTRVLVRFA